MKGLPVKRIPEEADAVTGKPDLQETLYKEVLLRLDLKEAIGDGELLSAIDAVLSDKSSGRVLSYAKKKYYRALLFASFRRYDVLSMIMDDPEVTEIMVNGPNEIFVEKRGRITRYDGHFTTPEKLPDIIQKIAASVNRRVNEASPLADARLPDGSRVNIVLPPVALDGPIVTIRRFSKEPISMEQLVSWESLDADAAGFLADAVRERKNIFVSGGTGSGKTTFLGALAEFIPQDQRVITVEDSAELRLRNVRNLVRLETRPANLEGHYEITIRQLIRNALRMRPDRIIVGEVRGEEALDMLQAMNTGAAGSMSTGHSNSAKDMISRIETMVLFGASENGLPLPAVRAQIASSLDLIVHLRREVSGKRLVEGIYEVKGMKEGEVVLERIRTERKMLTMQDTPMIQQQRGPEV